MLCYYCCFYERKALICCSRFSFQVIAGNNIAATIVLVSRDLLSLSLLRHCGSYHCCTDCSYVIPDVVNFVLLSGYDTHLFVILVDIIVVVEC